MQHIIRHFKAVDPILHGAITGDDWMRLKRRPQRFPALCRIIIGQQVSTKAAAAIYTRFCALFPRKHPTTGGVLVMPEETLRSAGLSTTKCASICDLAAHIEKKRLPLQKLHHYTDEELIAALTQIRGIGRWSAEMFMIFTLGREDIFSPGDLGLRNALHMLYGLPDVPTSQEAEAMAQIWTPYRSYACRILWDSLTQK